MFLTLWHCTTVYQVNTRRGILQYIFANFRNLFHQLTRITWIKECFGHLIVILKSRPTCWRRTGYAGVGSCIGAGRRRFRAGERENSGRGFLAAPATDASGYAGGMPVENGLLLLKTAEATSDCGLWFAPLIMKNRRPSWSPFRFELRYAEIANLHVDMPGNFPASDPDPVRMDVQLMKSGP